MSRFAVFLILALWSSGAGAWSVAGPLRSELARMTDVFRAKVVSVKVVPVPCPEAEKAGPLTMATHRDIFEVTFDIGTVYKGVLSGTFFHRQPGVCGTQPADLYPLTFEKGQEWYVLARREEGAHDGYDANFIPIQPRKLPIIKRKLILEFTANKEKADAARKAAGAAEGAARKEAYAKLAEVLDDNADDDALARLREEMKAKGIQ